MAERRIKAILEAQDRASPTFRRVSGAVKALGIVAAAVGINQIGRQLVRGLQSAVTAAAEYESAAVRLNVALANQGQLTPQSSKAFRDFARDLTDVSLATETQILSAIAQAKALGASDKAAKGLTTAAVDLAAATGVDMDTAFRQVNRTLGGYAGELGEVIPELKSLTAEQLRSGDAAAILASKFRGAGAAGANTYRGSVNNLQSALEQLKVEVGGPLAEVIRELNNVVLIPLVKTLRDGVKQSTDFRDTLLGTAEGIARAGVAAERAVGPLDKLLRIWLLFKGIGDLRTQFKGLEEISTRVRDFVSGLPALAAIDPSVIGAVTDELTTGSGDAATALEKLVERLQALRAQDPKTLFEGIGQAAGEMGASVAGTDGQGGSLGGVLGLLQEIGEQAQRVARLFNSSAEQIDLEPLIDKFEEASELIEMTHQEVIDSVHDMAVKSAEEVAADLDAIQSEIVRFNQRAIKAMNTFLDKWAERLQLIGFVLEHLFGVNKAVAIANAIVNTAEAITMALKAFVPPFNFVMAGLVAAAGAKQIATIRSAAVGAQHGIIVPGINRGGDSVGLQVQPGEAVLPRQLTEFLLQAASRGFGGGAEVIELRMDEGIVARRLSDGVQRGSVRLVASRLKDSRVTR